MQQEEKELTMVSALDLIDETIAELEARLNIKPGEAVGESKTKNEQNKKKKNKKKKNKNENKNENKKEKKQPQAADATTDQPVICKLEFKVGVITKVWVHEKADKLYCEEIDVGEASGPRQIASGLRPHFSLEEMMGQRLLVISNLKANNLVGFKSHGMVLCAAKANDAGSETVEFVEPPPDAAIGEVVTFEGLPKPEPFSPAQVEKRKVLLACAEGMKTTDECLAVWNGHIFMTSAGPCRATSIAGGVLRYRSYKIP
jgi:aminoacyl tRNA synthase complex-interacting multifunctional protein 1